MRTNATDDPWKWQVSENDLHGLPVLALGNQRHIPVSVNMVGASIGAGRSIALIDHVTPWDRLGVRFVCGFSGAESQIELAG
jgi:hypothetical protein